MNTLRCKSKPKIPFNIAQNQEFELVTSHHFKNLLQNPHGTVSGV